MNKYITRKNDISTYLEFSNLQIASEAFIGNTRDQERPGTEKNDIKWRDAEELKRGDFHTSKFTDIEAQGFIQRWKVVQHKANTATGFSGTLFEAKASIGCALAHHPQNQHCATRRSVHTAHTGKYHG